MMFDLADSIKDDWKIFDNNFPGKIIHVDKTSPVNFISGTVTNPVTETVVDGCLFRDVSKRNASSIRQTTSRDGVIQNDTFYKTDLVVEVPMIDGLTIDEGDKFVDLNTTIEYNIVSVDHATLTTRFRLAITRFN